MTDESNVIRLHVPPLHQRFIRSYRAWRAYGLSPLKAAAAAWRICRVLSKVC
jgi:hypothetical protein